MTVLELYEKLNEKMPSALACPWDRDGLQVAPNQDAEVSAVIVALDVTKDVISAAKIVGANVILTHHPLLFNPTETVNGADVIGGRLIECIQNNIAVMSFHTRLDKVEGGVNDTLAKALDLDEVTPFGVDAIGRVGLLKKKDTLKGVAKTLLLATGTPAVEIVNAGVPVKKIALLGGAGGDEMLEAKACGADTYVTGEVHHHHILSAKEMGVNLLVGGHYYTENLVCDVLKAWVREIDKTIKVQTVKLKPSEFLTRGECVEKTTPKAKTPTAEKEAPKSTPEKTVKKK